MEQAMKTLTTLLTVTLLSVAGALFSIEPPPASTATEGLADRAHGHRHAEDRSLHPRRLRLPITWPSECPATPGSRPWP